jgi:hypothetical protein
MDNTENRTSAGRHCKHSPGKKKNEPQKFVNTLRNNRGSGVYSMPF